MTINKKIKLNLVGVDAHYLSIMGAFSKRAQKEGWPKEEIKEVLDEAMNADYDHLLATIISYCK